MNYAEVVLEDRRLVMLRTLRAECPGRSANCRVLQKLLDQYGHTVTLDRVKTDAAWLAEQDLVTKEPFDVKGGEDYLVIKLTRRGTDVAKGIIEVPGVAVPGE